MTTVAVLDYGMGNLRSVCKALERVGAGATIKLTSQAADIARADRVVFPGQGAIAGCMTALGEGALRESVVAAVRQKPFLGICLGLQALYETSEEGGGTPCLGILHGAVRRFALPQDAKTAPMLKVPHMGWNQVRQARAHPMWRGIEDGERFYFVHSYFADTATAAETVGVTEYGPHFTSAAARDNIFAVQFHPEKSQRAGLKLLENFINWNGET